MKDSTEKLLKRAEDDKEGEFLPETKQKDKELTEEELEHVAGGCIEIIND